MACAVYWVWGGWFSCSYKRYVAAALYRAGWLPETAKNIKRCIITVLIGDLGSRTAGIVEGSGGLVVQYGKVVRDDAAVRRSSVN